MNSYNIYDSSISTISLIDSNNTEVFINPFILNNLNERKHLKYVMLTILNMDDLDLSGNLVINGVTVNNIDTSVFKINYPLDNSLNGIGDSNKSYFLIEDEKPSDFSLYYLITYDSEYGPGEPLYGKIIFSKNKIFSETNKFSSAATALKDTNSSFLMMRTNPLLTGNIKLVVDEKEDLYLDTFKINDILNKNEYRKCQVSASSTLSTDIRNYFSSIPSDILYAVPSDDLKAHSVFTDFSKQFDTIYSYGVETNMDELYNESFSFLAPLWINKQLPDYFVIFKLPGSHSPSNYKSLTDTEIFDLFLKEGTLVKSYSMKKSSPLGNYLRNHYSSFSTYPGSVRLQFKEHENLSKYENGLNSWMGMSVDSGLYNKLDEISYFANKIINNNSQELFNAFITEGFKRNRLLCPNLINLEFKFSDADADDLEMNRYFGLYLKENDFLKYDFVENHENANKSVSIIKYDTGGNIINDSIISSDNSSIIKKYPDRLFFAISPGKILRIKKYDELNTFLKNEISSLPYENISSTFTRPVVFSNDMKNFMSLKFKKTIHYGEHFRIVIPKYTEGKLSIPVIFEIIASNDDTLLDFEDNISPYISLINHNTSSVKSIYYRSRKKHDQTSTTTTSNDDFYKAKSGEYFEEDKNSTIADSSLFKYLYAVKYENTNKATGILNSVDSSSFIDEKTYPYIFRINFYTQSIFNSSVPASLQEQIYRISKCIEAFREAFDIKLYVSDMSDSQLSLISSYDDVFFEHITSDILNNDYVTLYNEMRNDTGGMHIYTLNDVIQDASSLKADDTLSYLNDIDFGIRLHPLSPDIINYSSESICFAPLDFELLGWRNASIVKFVPANARTFNFYEINENDINILGKNIIVRNTDNIYRKIYNMPIYENYVFSKDINEPDNMEKNILEVNTKYLPAVLSPFNSGKYIISSEYPIDIVSGKINFYSSIPITISLMGILPVKDLDSQIGIEEDEHINSVYTLTIPENTKIYIDNNLKEYSLNSDVFYTVLSGAFQGISLSAGGSFIIINKIMYFKGKNKKFQTYEIKNEFIRSSIHSSDILKITSNSWSIKNDYNNIKPIQREIFMFNNQDSTKDLVYPLLTPVILTWKSIGCYYDQNSILDVGNILNPDYKDIYKGYMCFHYPYSDTDENRFISKSFSSYVEDPSGNEMSLKEFMLTSKISDGIDMFLTEKVRPLYTIGYYNKYIDKLEFVFYGIKFSIGFNSNEFIKKIRLSNYNEYEIFILNDFTGEKNELIINTIENIILFVNHNFNYRKFDDKIVNFNIKDNHFTYSRDYNWIRTTFNVDMSDSEADKDNIYVPVSTENNTPHVLFGDELWQYESISENEEYVYSLMMGGIELSSQEKFLKFKADTNIYTNFGTDSNNHTTLSSFFITPDKQIATTIRNYLINPYISENDFTSYTDTSVSRADIFDNMIQDYENTMSPDNFNVYVKMKDNEDVSVFSFETSIGYTPFSINCSTPKKVKYNIDFYNPDFIDIINFDLNEENEIIEKTKMNFVLANTHFKKINPIKNYYGYKIFPEVSFDLTGNSNNYFVNKEQSLIKSSWDSSYYRYYKDINDFSYIDGYMTGIEDKSFFASKGINIKDCSFMISSWNVGEIETVKNDELYFNGNKNLNSKDNYTITFNLTQAFYDQFLNDIDDISKTAFKSNWKDFNYNQSAINNYIKLTLINYFKINNKNEFTLYSLKNNGNGEYKNIFLTTPPDNITDFSREKNISSTIFTENNYVKLRINITDVTKYYYATYFVKSII